MSLEQHAFIEKAMVPSRHDWQTAIDGLGFGLQIDIDVELFMSSEFCPCKLAGKTSGFELYLGPAEDLLRTFPDLRRIVANRKFAVSFRWGGDMAECACVLIASAALAKSFDAVVYFPTEARVCSTDDLVREANLALRECVTTSQSRVRRSVVGRLLDHLKGLNR